MKKNILNCYAFNLNYGKMLVADVPEDSICTQPETAEGQIKNHAAWVIGHLAQTCDFLGPMLGLEPACPSDWGELFGNGSTPVDDAAKYPNKETLLKAYEDGHVRLAEAFEVAGGDRLDAPIPEESLRKLFPTIGDMIVFGFTGHEATHLGQLSVWRRALGLPSVF